MSQNFIFDILHAICESGTRFVVVGGFAAILHGVNRVTSDIDVVVDFSRKGALTLVETLLAAGLQARIPDDPRLFAEEAKRQEWITQKNMRVLSFFHPRFPGFAVDLFVDPPMRLDELEKHAEKKAIGNLQVPVASAADLIEMKRKAGRPLDLQDIADLRDIQERPHTDGA